MAWGRLGAAAAPGRPPDGAAAAGGGRGRGHDGHRADAPARHAAPAPRAAGLRAPGSALHLVSGGWQALGTQFVSAGATTLLEAQQAGRRRRAGHLSRLQWRLRCPLQRSRAAFLPGQARKLRGRPAPRTAGSCARRKRKQGALALPRRSGAAEDARGAARLAASSQAGAAARLAAAQRERAALAETLQAGPGRVTSARSCRRC